MLNGFLPLVARRRSAAAPASRRGLRELGLPYETDRRSPGISRRFWHGRRGSPATAPSRQQPCGHVRPDAVLFNGGFFTPPLARARFSTRSSRGSESGPGARERAPEAAVAIGAAFYGIRRDRDGRAAPDSRRQRPRLLRRRPVREAPGSTTAVCVMPRGTRKGQRVVLDREFTVVANQPAAFTLSARPIGRIDSNDVVTFGDGDDVHRHAPLVTALRYGQRSRRVPLAVRLAGTSPRPARSSSGASRSRRSTDGGCRSTCGGGSATRCTTPPERLAGDQVVIVRGRRGGRAAARERARPGLGWPVSSLRARCGELETLIGHGKHAWPLSTIRALTTRSCSWRTGALPGRSTKCAG